MPTPALPPLVIGSCQPFSGKSAVVLGLARQLSRLGVSISFGKPLATCLDDPDAAHPAADAVPLDADVRFIAATLGLSDSQLLPSVHVQDAGALHQRLLSGELAPGEAFAALQRRLAEPSDHLALLEAAGSLSEAPFTPSAGRASTSFRSRFHRKMLLRSQCSSRVASCAINSSSGAASSACDRRDAISSVDRNRSS